MTFSRKNQINKLKKNDEYDLFVIGGGIVGAATLTIASNAGLNVLLVDKNDFASGASSRSTKLLHGGIRYLLPRISENWKSRFLHGGIR